MTGQEIISKALILLGYSDGLGSSDARFQVAAKNALNFIYSDLFYRSNNNGFKEAALNENIDLPEKVLNDCMPYGVAAFIATCVGDGDKQQYFSSIYNLKRKSVVGKGSVDDIVPAP